VVPWEGPNTAHLNTLHARSSDKRIVVGSVMKQGVMIVVGM
jgi:hypothetical protein